MMKTLFATGICVVVFVSIVLAFIFVLPRVPWIIPIGGAAFVVYCVMCFFRPPMDRSAEAAEIREYMKQHRRGF